MRNCLSFACLEVQQVYSKAILECASSYWVLSWSESAAVHVLYVLECELNFMLTCRYEDWCEYSVSKYTVLGKDGDAFLPITLKSNKETGVVSRMGCV